MVSERILAFIILCASSPWLGKNMRSFKPLKISKTAIKLLIAAMYCTSTIQVGEILPRGYCPKFVRSLACANL